MDLTFAPIREHDYALAFRVSDHIERHLAAPDTQSVFEWSFVVPC